MKDNLLSKNYHDANLINYKLGPRNEITLIIVLDPIWNNNIKKEINIRFGAIENMEEVRQFFTSFEESNLHYLDEIMEIKLIDKTKWLIDFSNSGKVIIISNKIKEYS